MNINSDISVKCPTNILEIDFQAPQNQLMISLMLNIMDLLILVPQLKNSKLSGILVLPIYGFQEKIVILQLVGITLFITEVNLVLIKIMVLNSLLLMDQDPLKVLGKVISLLLVIFLPELLSEKVLKNQVLPLLPLDLTVS